MTDNTVRKQFKAEHHAMLFAWMAGEIIVRAGEGEAAPIIRKAVRRYGEERGNRMAMRARANGHSCTMIDYLSYTEWKAGMNEVKMDIVAKRPNMRVKIPCCPWHTAWKESDLMAYGRYYCLDIDNAVLRGFNPALTLEVIEVKPDGALDCTMVFHGMNFTISQILSLLSRKYIRPGKRAIMPWDYHTGHIYKTVGDEFIEAFGNKGKEACVAATLKFREYYGHDAARIVEDYARCDFHRPAC
ncbi:MAG: L-2-amino-thiazoline-4-carboxylic acid hydrolase [Proteobacteria bacterium]|nr:L-2-amino-thiazoline-4-carboxylic acid hydrolase [Pseudomonadota bacterium]